MKNIAVIGSGSWGTAITSVLANNGHSVTLWSYLEEECEMFKTHKQHLKFLPGVILNDNVNYTNSIEEALLNKELIVIACPSFAIRSTVENIKPFYKNQLIVSIAKGLEEETLKCLSEVIEEVLNPEKKVCVLSGPSHAEEVGKKMATTLVAASLDIEVAKEVQDIFMCDYLRVYTSTDIIGVQLGGALKNVISLCVGISDGLGNGDNIKAAIMTRGMAEIIRLGTKMGGKIETFSGLTGVGDLIVTCTSMHSRNRRAGILIGQGKTPEEAKKEVGMVVEGMLACKSAYELSKKYQVEMPIVREAYGVLYENYDVNSSMENLMLREKREE